MNNIDRLLKRRIRIRSKVKGTQERPRLSVFRSNRFIYVQLIDDQKRETLVEASEKELLNKDSSAKTGKIEKAKEVGLLLAKKSLAKKIKEVVFDRGGYKYHGRVEALAKGAREGGLKF